MEEREALDINSPTTAGNQVGKVILNLLNFMIATFIVFILLISLFIYFNPHSPINPFPPPTPRAVTSSGETSSEIPDPTNTPFPTETSTPIPPPTLTVGPYATLPPSPTPFTLSSPTATLEPTEPSRGYQYELQQGSPIAIANISHPDLACEWMGVAGQVFDLSGGPVTGLLIQLGGRIPGVALPKDMLSLTGAALNYGRVGYYEFTLADEPVASNGSLWVQLVNQEYVPLSEKIYFDTYDSCDRNLIIINFKQVR